MNAPVTKYIASFSQLIDDCTERFSALSVKQQWAIYFSLERGQTICQDPMQLMAYNALFANLHYAKLQSLFDELLQSPVFFDQNIRVIDYGCGQGLASLVLHERNQYLELNHTFNELLLIEPSSVALQQAIKNNKPHYAHINPINKSFDELQASDLSGNSSLTVHLFSNVLDLPHIDIDDLAHCVKQGLSNTNLFVCCSPDFYSGNQLVNYFCSQFNPQESVFIRDTCDALCFDIKNQCLSSRAAKRYAKVFIC